MDAMARFAVLNRNGEFRALYHRGKSQVHPALVTYVRKSRTGYPRMGITTGKKVGCGAAQPLPPGDPGGVPRPPSLD